MGGIVYFAIPGDIDTPTGGYGYDRRLIAELPKLGWQVEHVALPDGFPEPLPVVLDETAAALTALPEGAVVLIDGLAYGAMPETARAFRDRLRLVALVHHPLADETGLSSDATERLEKSEREALRFAREVICTSHTTAKRLAEGFDVEPARVTVALPGSERHPPAHGSDGIPVILCLAAVVKRKGHDILIQALDKLRDRKWECRIVGALDRDPEWVAFLKAQTQRLGLSHRVRFVGPTTAPDDELQAADIFALPSRHEGYGMAFAEALAHGLPIVACKVGAVPEVVPPEAGDLVPVDDEGAFAEALGKLLGDRDERRRMAVAAWKAGQALPDWDATARTVAQALRRAAE